MIAPTTQSRALPRVLGTVLVLAVLAAAYSMLFYAGPYRWLAEAQLAFFDAYYPSLTAALTLSFTVVPPLVAIRVLVAGGALASDGLLAALVAQGGAAQFKARFAPARGWLITLGIGATIAVLASRDLIVMSMGKELERVAANELERGAETHSTWLEIAGEPDFERALETEESRKRITYVPIRAQGAPPRERVGALLRLTEGDSDLSEGQPLRGTVDVTGIPGMVRVAFEKQGLEVDDALLLELGKSPAERASASTFLLSFGGLLLVIGGIGSFFKLRKHPGETGTSA